MLLFVHPLAPCNILYRWFLHITSRKDTRNAKHYSYCTYQSFMLPCLLREGMNRGIILCVLAHAFPPNDHTMLRIKTESGRVNHNTKRNSRVAG